MGGDGVPKALLGLGFCSLLASVFLPWYRVPILHDHAGWQAVTSEYELGLKFALCAFSFGALLVCLKRGGSVLGGVAAMLALFVLLSFPRLAVVCDQETAVAAGWFNQVHSNLVWLGGDIALSQGVAEDLLLGDVLISDSPANYRAAPDPSALRRPPGLYLLSDLVEWIGFGDSFAAFVRLGWVLGVLGSISMIGAAGALATSRTRYIRSMAWTFLLAFSGSGLVALAPVWSAGGALVEAELATEAGLYGEAIEHMYAATEAVPLVAYDTRFVAQLGLLKSRAGQAEDPAARLYVARVRELGEWTAGSRGVYHTLLGDVNCPPNVKREAARSLAKLAYLSLNTGDISLALSDLRASLEVLGNDPKVMLGLQLAHLRSGDVSELQRSVMSVGELYSFVNLPSGDSVVAFGVDALARAEWAAGEAGRAYELANYRGRPR